MPKITFHPEGKTDEVQCGKSLLDAAEQMGVDLRHDCGGFATCSTCRILILDGVSNLTKVDLDEENMLEEAELTAPFRLSCQAKVLGDVTVRIPDEAMVWSKEAFEALSEYSDKYRELIQLMVEDKARGTGLDTILPETAIPLIEEAKKAVDEASDNPVALSAILKQVCDMA
ncbi:MAG: 2Fe-2S iron-sulfur cluster-binding protein [Nitrospiria bacterium]